MKKHKIDINIDQLSKLEDKELCDLSRSFNVYVADITKEIESGKFILQDRKALIERLENKWRNQKVIESNIIAIINLIFAIIAAIAAIASSIITFIYNR